jgi:hypothetical protein
MSCVTTTVAYSCIKDALERLERVASILVSILEGYSVEIGAREAVHELMMVAKSIRCVVAECTSH